jgi:hypothetical protein
MSENANNENVVHPADALAVAISRAGRLLSMLSDLYDAKQENFVTENSFIVHGISTANELIDEAGRALVDLHEKCDLSLLSASPPHQEDTADKTVAATPVVPPVAASKTTLPTSIMAAVETLQEVGKSGEPAARSYPEFLDKITKTQFGVAQSPEPAPVSGDVTPFLSALRREMQ